MSHQQPQAPQYPPAPTKEEYPDQEEYEERLSRWRWTVGRNRAFADLRAKTAQENQPAAPPGTENQTELPAAVLPDIATEVLAHLLASTTPDRLAAAHLPEPPASAETPNLMQPAADAAETQAEPLSPEFEDLVDELMADPKNKHRTREQIRATVARDLEASGG